MTDEAPISVKVDGYEPRCKACNYPGHDEHDKALLAGKLNDTDYAKIVGCTSKSIARHRSHISKDIAKAAEAMGLSRGCDLLDELLEIRQRALTLLDKAEEAGDTRSYGPPSTYLRELRELIRLRLDTVELKRMLDRLESLEKASSMERYR